MRAARSQSAISTKNTIATRKRRNNLVAILAADAAVILIDSGGGDNGGDNGDGNGGVHMRAASRSRSLALARCSAATISGGLIRANRVRDLIDRPVARARVFSALDELAD